MFFAKKKEFKNSQRGGIGKIHCQSSAETQTNVRWEAAAALRVTPFSTDKNNVTETTPMSLYNSLPYFFPKMKREVP